MLNLEDNRINNDGAQKIARSLVSNRSLLELNLLNQKGAQSTYGDATLSECVAISRYSRARWFGGCLWRCAELSIACAMRVCVSG